MGYLYEALKVDGDNRLELLFVPRVGKDVSKVFLQQLADTDPDAVHLVVRDQAGFHPLDSEEGVPDNVRLFAPAGSQSRTQSGGALGRYSIVSSANACGR